MAQSFVTTTQKDYRWHPIRKRKPLIPYDKLANTLPDGGIWLVPQKIEGDSGIGLEGAKEIIGNMYRKRLWSTYQRSYCKDVIAKGGGDSVEGGFEDQLLEYCHNLYNPKRKMIPPPIATARRSYVRPEKMYTPLTTYQNCHGKVAFKVLDDNQIQVSPSKEAIKKAC